ncbi:MAG TPA: DUF4942 domain-containing protein [Niabella sp.]|nr:DUF4942 domain-containing protein [Bacteroidia bacterium]HRB52062.1 DUF4942 domain-containing protein [Bacteroidia bacterium]HRC03130.1 DUF4942 domain-containing protein [Niabella sp.]
MFDKEFYPTPKHVITKMLQPYMDQKKRVYGGTANYFTDISILEPSAGKGDILDYINDKFSGKRAGLRYYCIERNQDLTHILNEKDYRVIAHDFLQYSGDYYFDFIIMNPPFSNGDEHLLKAWDVLRGGDIVCLLNTETLTNPNTERKQHLLKLIEKHGSFEHLGAVFADSERPTNVRVSMVRLHKVEEESAFNFKFEKVTKESQFDLNEDILGNEIARKDLVGNMMLQYDELRKAYIDYNKARSRVSFYSNGLMTQYCSIFKDVIDKLNQNTLRGDYNQFCDLVKKEIWRVIFGKIDMDKYMTHDVRQNFSKYIDKQGAMDFTKENVAQVVEMLFTNRFTILDKAVIDVFDIFTRHHKENRYLIEGWKTNDKWKVNRKVILPYYVKYGEYMSQHDLKQFGDKFSISYHRASEYTDIDKVMCYITGKDFKNCTTISEALKDSFQRLGHVKNEKFDNTCTSTFFNIRFFKKGTIHIEFRDAKLWEQFNLMACAGKKWLPETEQREYDAKMQYREEPELTITPKMIEANLEPITAQFELNFV